MKERLKKKRKGRDYIEKKELWNLDYTIARFALPRLIAFKKDNIGFPSEIKSKSEWDSILDKMIDAFDLVVNGEAILDDEKYAAVENVVFDNESKGLKFIVNEEKKAARVNEENRQNEIIREGLGLFSTYFRDLWW